MQSPLKFIYYLLLLINSVLKLLFLMDKLVSQISNSSIMLIDIHNTLVWSHLSLKSWWKSFLIFVLFFNGIVKFDDLLSHAFIITHWHLKFKLKIFESLRNFPIWWRSFTLHVFDFPLQLVYHFISLSTLNLFLTTERSHFKFDSIIFYFQILIRLKLLLWHQLKILSLELF